MALVKGVDQDSTLDADKKKALMEATAELADAEKPYETDRARLLADLDSFLGQSHQLICVPVVYHSHLYAATDLFHAITHE